MMAVSMLSAKDSVFPGARESAITAEDAFHVCLRTVHEFYKSIRAFLMELGVIQSEVFPALMLSYRSFIAVGVCSVVHMV